jgi:hypothetical protein
VGNKSLLFQTTQCKVFCYSSLSRQRHNISKLKIDAKKKKRKEKKIHDEKYVKILNKEQILYFTQHWK